MKTKALNPYTFKYSVKRPTNLIFHKYTASGSYWYEGIVITEHGIVSVCSYPGEKKEESITRLDVARDGANYVNRVYSRHSYSKQYLVTLAVRFARDIDAMLKEQKEGTTK